MFAVYNHFVLGKLSLRATFILLNDAIAWANNRADYDFSPSIFEFSKGDEIPNEIDKRENKLVDLMVYQA